jgi:hypothetical protein
MLPDLYLDKTFTDFEKQRIIRAYNLLSKVLVDPKLTECIGRNSKSVIAFKQLSIKDVTEITNPILLSKGNFYITKFTEKNAVGGDSKLDSVENLHDSFQIRINVFNRFSPKESDVFTIVDTLFHEYLHTIGYDHPGRIQTKSPSSQFKGNLVYEAGWCAAKIAENHYQ